MSLALAMYVSVCSLLCVLLTGLIIRKLWG